MELSLHQASRIEAARHKSDRKGKSTGSYRERLAAGISRYTDADRKALDVFKRSVWGDEALHCAPDYFRWQFEQSPYKRDEGSQIWIYRKDGRVYGQQAGLPVLLKVGDQYYRGSWAIDLMVAPAFRLRGVGAVLSETYVADNDVTIGIGITDDAFRAFRRAGWLDLGEVPLFVRPLDAVEMLKTRWRPIAGRFIGAVINAGLRCLAWGWRLRSMAVRIRLKEIDRFDERMDELWHLVSPHYAIIAQRDCGYLNWRYVDHPQKNRYRRFLLSRGDELLGYAVLRLGRRHDVSAGYVVDFLCAPKHIGTLFGACLPVLRRWGAAVAYCSCSGVEAQGCLKWLGFKRRRSGAHMMVRTDSIDEQSAQLISRRDNWFVTAGDSDTDRPQEDLS